MQFTSTSLLFASVAMLAAAKPAPQGFNLGESKFFNAPTRQSCNDVPGGNGYYCDAAANLVWNEFHCAELKLAED
ncbi:uncharacterized protein RHO25_005580 [Cercospora beticola]|uniref:Uncharacterized protein n=1 Tax=Cercospora beticola TaxID=122368 RepID=A0ABZ0NNA5_CERBT|nr:hypothetical protein RHO25_005580 [Cercospora beticola]